MKILKDKRILEIAEADPKDAEELINYLNAVGKESSNLILDEEGVDMAVEDEAELIRSWKETYNNKEFVGKVEGKIVSTCGIRGNPRKRVRHNVRIGISVLKDYWNLGIAGHMMEYVLNYCRMTKEIENIMLEVRADNEHAIHLYEKLGFKLIGRAHRKFKIAGNYHDEFIYELLL